MFNARAMLKRKLGVDLGTATVRIYLGGKGIVVREPSVVALAKDSGGLRAVGEEAYRLLGQSPTEVVTVRPLRDGVIADYALSEAMLKAFMARVIGAPGRLLGRALGPSVMACVPSGVGEGEKQAVLRALREAGAGEAALIDAPLAAAIGAGLHVTGATGAMVVDIGGGSTDIAITALGGVVVAESLRVAGSAFDEAIVRALRSQEELLIGNRTAEELKLRLGAGSAKARGDQKLEVQNFEEQTLEVRGRDLGSGLPKTVTVSSEVVAEALREPLQRVADGVQRVLETAPAELVADVVNAGITLTGAGARLGGVDDLLRRSSGLQVFVAEHAADCTVLGLGKALELTEVLEDALTVEGR